MTPEQTNDAAATLGHIERRMADLQAMEAKIQALSEQNAEAFTRLKEVGDLLERRMAEFDRLERRHRDWLTEAMAPAMRLN